MKPNCSYVSLDDRVSTLSGSFRSNDVIREAFIIMIRTPTKILDS